MDPLSRRGHRSSRSRAVADKSLLQMRFIQKNERGKMSHGPVYSRLCSMCSATRECENDISGVLALICFCQWRLSQKPAFFFSFTFQRLPKTPAFKGSLKLPLGRDWTVRIGLKHCLTDTMSYGSGSSRGLTRAARLSAFAMRRGIWTGAARIMLCGNMSWE